MPTTIVSRELTEREALPEKSPPETNTKLPSELLFGGTEAERARNREEEKINSPNASQYNLHPSTPLIAPDEEREIPREKIRAKSA